MSVDPHHRLKVSFTGEHRSATHETAKRAFLDISRQGLTLGHRAGRSGGGISSGLCFGTRAALIRGVRFGVVRSLLPVAGAVVLFLILGFFPILSISYLRIVGARDVLVTGAVGTLKQQNDALAFFVDCFLALG